MSIPDVIVGLDHDALVNLALCTASVDELAGMVTGSFTVLALRQGLPLIDVVESLVASARIRTDKFEVDRDQLLDDLAVMTSEWDQLRAANLEARGV